MNYLLKIISCIGLALTLLPALLVVLGAFEKEVYMTLMFIGALLWFISAPFWMKSPSLENKD